MIMNSNKRLPVAFFKNENDKEPVREWLMSLPLEDKKTIGVDIQTVEFGWPIGMPLCKPMTGQKGLWEVRSRLSDKRIARVLFCVQDSTMVLLHGFIKKTQKTPDKDLKIAVKRMKGLNNDKRH